MSAGDRKGTKSGTLLLVAGTLVAIGAVVWFWPRSAAPENEHESGGLRGRKVSVSTSSRKSAAHGPLAKRVRRQKGENVEVKAPPVKPNFLDDIDEDKKMTAEMKKLFLELQAALDLDDKKKVFALVNKLQLMDEWPDGIPKSVKMKALQALSWFGASGMAEAVGFLADSDPEIRQESLSKFEEMLSDWDLGDTGISEIIRQVVKVVHDKDALDAFYWELNNMRPTVKAETVLAIYDSQNPDAISVLQDSMEFVFDSDGEIRSREEVEQYLADARKAYEEDPAKAAEDEEFYGPPKN